MNLEDDPPPHASFLRATPGEGGLYDVDVVVDDRRLGRVERVVFASATGSYLFGTDHEESDYDLKGVFVESLEAIILERDRSDRQLRTREDSELGGREPEVDVEFLELRRFVRDLLEGHPYAVEMLHAPPSLQLVRTPVWDRLYSERSRLLSARVEPFVGYCRAQAHRYGEKADRLAAVESVLERLEAAERDDCIRSVVDDLDFDSEHVEIVEQPIRGQPDPVELLRVVDKKYELEAPISKALDSLESLRETYGERVRSVEDGLDWKAIAHAYRIALELRELRETGRLEFPLEEAEFLGRIRRGEISHERVQRELPDLVEKAIATPTSLPDAPDESFWEEWLVGFYTHHFRNR